MAESEIKHYLNPIALEAHLFLKSIEKYGSQYQMMDKELLNVMDELVDAINKFYDNSITKIEESDNLKLIKVKEAELLLKRSYTCTLCHKYLGDSTKQVTKHICNSHPNIQEPRRKKRTTETSGQNDSSNGVKLPKSARLLLTSKLPKLFKEASQWSQNLKQIPEYHFIDNDLKNTLQSIYPEKDVKTYKFGSRISGIGNPNSDLDIFVDINGSFHIYENSPSTQTIDAIKRVSGALKKNKKWSHVIAIQSARVPIIRLVHSLTGIHCDIGFSNSLGYCNTMLMQYFFELQPIASRICICMKKWLDRTKLNDNISTYSFTLMVIYYLQICHILPSVEELQEDVEKPEYVGPWMCNFRKKTLDELNLEPFEITKESLREQMYNFFVFYCEFDYQNWVICPYLGERVSAAAIIDELPKRYIDFVEKRESNAGLQLNKPIVVQDPFDLRHNVTKSISASLLKVIITYFKDSADIINSNESEKTSTNNASSLGKNSNVKQTSGE